MILAVAGLLLIVLLKSTRAEYAFMLKVAILMVIGISLLGVVSKVVSEIQALGSTAGIDSEMLKLLLKSMGLCMVTQLAANLCKDSGESAMATGVELAGSVGILIMALPLATELVKWSLTWIGQ